MRPPAFRSDLPRHREGISLLEVLISLAIFLTAITAIGQLVTIGSRAAVDAELEGEAAQRAESVLNEILAGVHPMSTTPATPFGDDPNWKWSLTVESGPHADLLQLTVSVFRQAGETDPIGQPFQLKRLTRNPEVFLESSLQGGT